MFAFDNAHENFASAPGIAGLDHKIVAIFMYGLVKREKRDYER